MAMVYMFVFDDGYFYIGKTTYKNIENRYKIDRDYSPKLLDKINSGVDYHIEFLSQVNNYDHWNEIDFDEEIFIRQNIDNSKCLNSQLAFVSLYDLVKHGTDDKIVLKVVDDYVHNNLNQKETAEKNNVSSITLNCWLLGKAKKGLLESNGYIFPITKKGLTDDEKLTLKIIEDYVCNDFNIRQTAEKYNIHPETLRYWTSGKIKRGLLESNGYTFPIKKLE